MICADCSISNRESRNSSASSASGMSTKRLTRSRSTSLLWILQEELKIPITRAHETVEAAAADPEVAERLDIPLLSPVMHVKRVMYTEPDRPLELVESYYRADRYQYSVNLIRVKRDGKWAWDHKS